jgi:hypothetical protein
VPKIRIREKVWAGNSKRRISLKHNYLFSKWQQMSLYKVWKASRISIALSNTKFCLRKQPWLAPLVVKARNRLEKWISLKSKFRKENKICFKKWKWPPMSLLSKKGHQIYLTLVMMTFNFQLPKLLPLKKNQHSMTQMMIAQIPPIVALIILNQLNLPTRVTWTSINSLLNLLNLN